MSDLEGAGDRCSLGWRTLPGYPEGRYEGETHHACMWRRDCMTGSLPTVGTMACVWELPVPHTVPSLRAWGMAGTGAETQRGPSSQSPISAAALCIQQTLWR